ncbi:MAG: LysR substrate-binding domain-containing protein [Sulfuritalea sp.]|nr:LysR substrate-binding domain-containing protein [Sulfuritalea sp.]
MDKSLPLSAPTAELRAFHATARMGGMSAAARHLRLTQPTVSAHIASIERRYGVELFLRRGRRVELTEVGRILLDIVNRLFEAESEAHSLLLETKAQLRGQLRISAVGPFNVTPMLRLFHERYSHIRLTVNLGDSRQIVERILDYQADVGVLVHAVHDERILALPYRVQPLVVFAHRSHRLAQRGSVRLADLEGEEFIVREAGSTTQRVFEDGLRAAGVTVRVAMEIGSRESIREAVAECIGLGVVSKPAYVSDPRLVPLEIEGADLATHSHVICLKNRQYSRLVAQFLKIVEELRMQLQQM